jgi:hypothetical protein
MTLQFTARKAFAALFVSFLFHNIEEAISICSYPVQNPVSYIKPASCNQFLWAVSIITGIVIILFITALRTKKPTVYLFISTAIASALVLNAIVPHITVAIFTFNYTPGLITAIALNLPLGLLTLFKNKSNYKSRKQFYQHIGIGLAVGYLLFALVMSLVIHFVQ